MVGYLIQVEMFTFNAASNRIVGLIDLLRCCPKLTELGVNCSADDISRLIFNIQYYSLNLRKLNIGESVHRHSKAIEALIRACRRGRSLEILEAKAFRLWKVVTLYLDGNWTSGTTRASTGWSLRGIWRGLWRLPRNRKVLREPFRLVADKEYLRMIQWKQSLSTSSYGGVSNTKQTRTVFCPKDLQTCLLVCKYWYKTLLPVLWNRYSSPAMDNIPSAIIARYSPLFRIFDAHGCDFSASVLGGRSNNNGSVSQVGLTLVEDDGDGNAEQRLDMQRQLVCVRRSMGLVWQKRKKDNALNPDHFVLLKTTNSSTQDLRNTRWTRSQGTLANMVRKVVTVLEPVPPSSVDQADVTIDTPQKTHQLSTPPSAGPKKERRGKSSRNKSNTAIAIRHFPGLTCRLLFPLIETVSADYLLEDAEILDLVVSCPNLRTLIVTIVKPFDLVALADGLSTACPHFRSLTFYLRNTADNTIDTPNRVQLAPFIRTCSASGLVYLSISTIYELSNELATSILTHATTLEELSISVNGRVYLSPVSLRQVLVGCRTLRELYLCGRMDTSPKELFRILRCLSRKDFAGLERLELDIVFTKTSSSLHSGGGGAGLNGAVEETEGEEGMFFISSNLTFMGWCCYGDQPNRLQKGLLSALFESVQDLQMLHHLVWAFQAYSRSLE
ncbi:hypothetical protein BGZ47_006024 [Haplosporangium gracile]|nr:hypothetical protein BGZ47_006024 [Haplosporangium gracile]